MGYGVDRGGGRESKGGSLRRSKKNPGAAAARVAKATKAKTVTVPYSLPAPEPRSKDKDIDSGVAILSRKLDPTRDRLLETAEASGCGACVVWSSEYEKQEVLFEYTADQLGALYVVCGIHPDNVDRTNKKLHAEWIKSIEELAKAPQCVAVLAGLNLRRDNATHFAQETLLSQLSALASNVLRLPTMLHIPPGNPDSLERALELAIEAVDEHHPLDDHQEEEEEQEDRSKSSPLSSSGPRPLIVHNVLAVAEGNMALLEHIAGAKVYVTISAARLCDEEAVSNPEIAEQSAAVLKSFSKECLLVASNSPWCTPQNLEDEYLRVLPNEPCNLSAVIQSLSRALGMSTESTQRLLLDNAVNAFQLTGGKATYSAFARDQEGSSATTTTGVQQEEDDDQQGEGNLGQEDESCSENDVDDQDGRVNPNKATGGTATKEQTGEREEEEEEGVEEQQGALCCVPRQGTSSNAFYSCVKCRAVLFKESILVTHPEGAPTASFKSTGKGHRGAGSCDTALFLLTQSDAMSGDGTRTLLISGDGCDVLECGGCGCKIGSVGGDVPCPCGVILPGSTARVLASRVDRFEELSQEELLAKAAKERELASDAESSEDDCSGKKKKKGPKQNVKKSNKMNLCSFRNKGSIPRKAQEVLEHELHEANEKTGGLSKAEKKKGKKKGTRRGRYDSSEDD